MANCLLTLVIGRVINGAMTVLQVKDLPVSQTLMQVPDQGVVVESRVREVRADENRSEKGLRGLWGLIKQFVMVGGDFA